MKHKIIYSIISLVTIIVLYTALSERKNDIFQNIKKGDEKQSVIEKMGEDYIGGNNFSMSPETIHLIDVYCWKEKKIEFWKKDQFPYFMKVELTTDYIIQFQDQKVIELSSSDGVDAINDFNN